MSQVETVVTVLTGINTNFIIKNDGKMIAFGRKCTFCESILAQPLPRDPRGASARDTVSREPHAANIHPPSGVSTRHMG